METNILWCKMKEWFQKNKKELLFFVVCFLVIGTMGVWLPILCDKSTDNNAISIGLITISIGFISSTAEKILEIMKSKKGDEGMIGIIYIVTIIVIFVLAIISITQIPTNIKTEQKTEQINATALTLALVSYILVCVMWWVQNRDNKTLKLVTPTTTMGGDNF